MKYRKYAKKSIVAAHELTAGTEVSESDFKFMFADKMGLPPDRVRQLVGKVTQRDIPIYQLINESDVS
jgi:sialic acid synthase SpsE